MWDEQSQSFGGNLMKKIFLALCLLIPSSISLIYKGQNNASFKKALASEQETLNIIDKNEMYTNANTTIVGNVLKFGPSIGAFVSYKSKKTYDNLHMEFDSSFSPNLSPDWQRVILRADEIDDSLHGEVNGYFVSLYKDNYHLYKQEQFGSYISLANAYYPETCLNEDRNNIYTGKFYHFSFDCYNDGNSVVIKMDINGSNAFTYIDNGAAGKGTPHLRSGYAGLYMNSTDASWIIRSEMTDSTFNENIFLGNEDIYDTDSTALIKRGEVELSNNQFALVNKEKSIAQAKFTYNTKQYGSDDKIFSFGSFASKGNAKNYVGFDGVLTDFYKNSIVIRHQNNVKTAISFASNLNQDVEIKYVSFFVANLTFVAIKVQGLWHVFDFDTVNKASGYVALFGHGSVTLHANSEPNRNFRVLFIGNSITNHGPNQDLNYHIGATSESWGMAVSDPQYDYVHRTVNAIRNVPGYEETEFMAINVANWEHDIALYDYANVYHAGAEFEADLIVGRLGENVTSSPSAIHFEYYYNQLLNFFNSKGTAKIVLTTKYWGSANHLKDDSVDTGIINLARHHNYPLVRLNDLGSTYASINNATADYDYYHSLEGSAPGGLSWADEYDGWTDGVKEHPGMVGHKNIAARISECVTRLLKGENAFVNTLEQIDENLYVEYSTSSINQNEDGAYDYRRTTTFKTSVITDFSKYHFANNYIPFKGYNIETDGVAYRYQMTLEEDTTAPLTYKCYTLDNSGSNLKEINCINNADSYRDGYLTIDGNVNKILIICVEYNLSKIFPANIFSDAKYSAILNFVNRNNERFVVDLSSMHSRYLTLTKEVFSIFIASGKDIEIILNDGSFIIERKTFEAIASMNEDLTFTLEKLNSNNDISNVRNVIAKYSGIYEIEDSIYEVKITHNGRNGDPLYVEKGIKVIINKALTDEQVRNLAIMSAALPAIGNEVTNIGVLDKNQSSYSNGQLTIEMKDFSQDIFLTMSEHKEGIELKGNFKTEYKVNEELDTKHMTLVYTNLLGEKKNISVSKYMVEGFDSSKVGENKITITYRGYTIEQTLIIKAAAKKGCGSSIPNMGLWLSIFALSGALIFIRLRKKAKEER